MKKFNVKELVITEPKKSSLDMSCNVKGTGKLGKMIPVFHQELLPNTSIHYTPNTLAKFVPVAVPLMSRISMRHHVLAVPFRQLYKDWEKFITGGEFNTDNSHLPVFDLRTLYRVASVSWFNLTIPVAGKEQYWNLLTANYQLTGSTAFRPDQFVQCFEHTMIYEEFVKFGYIEVLNAVIYPYMKILRDVNPAHFQKWDDTLKEAVNMIYCLTWNLLIGTGSLLDSLGYPVRDFVEMYRKKHSPMSIDFGVIRGINSGNVTETEFNDAPLRAYYRIWYYYFRDENVDIVVHTPEEIKSITTSITSLSPLYLIQRPACWEKDLFNTTTLQAYENNAFVPVDNENSSNVALDTRTIDVYDPQTDEIRSMAVPSGMLDVMQYANNDVIISALDNACTSFSLKNLQKVEALSKWLDKNLYGGWTYADQLSSHFGVSCSDARMQIPEYVCGTKSWIDCNTLTNNTSTSEQLAGDQAAQAQGITANDGGKYFAEEHCIIMDIMSFIPQLSYKYSTPKHLLRQKKFDFAFPEFAQLGCDLMPKLCIGNSISEVGGRETNIEGFGYCDRYAEYKNNVNRITGKMTSDLPLYYFSQDYSDAHFDSNPVLNPSFVHCVPSVDAFVSDSIEYEFMFDHNADVKATIPLPVVEYV